MRKNTVTWTDVEVLTRKMAQLQISLVDYQKYTLPDENRGQGCPGGDSNVMVACIELRNRLNQLIEKSPN